eukprot:COSAG03_NODE_14958_length_445_cov_8.092486_2_plen_38_part_01
METETEAEAEAETEAEAEDDAAIIRRFYSCTEAGRRAA